jgi:hypothetical protein
VVRQLLLLSTMSKRLSDYAFNRYSQNGEDGILEELCARLSIARGWCVEFGAWDGRYLSNTYSLLLNHGWQGVDIEGSPERYKDLLVTKAELSGRLHTICALVEVQGENTLDKLLSATPIPQDFDLLSIDIDSVDAQIWESIREYRPKIVVIECNSTLPPGVLQRHEPPKHIGASFSSLVELGRKKSYQLVCHTGNCIFVASELMPKVQLDPVFVKSPEKLFSRSTYFRAKVLTGMQLIFPAAIMPYIYKASGKWKKMRSRR